MANFNVEALEKGANDPHGINSRQIPDGCVVVVEEVSQGGGYMRAGETGSYAKVVAGAVIPISGEIVNRNIALYFYGLKARVFA